MLSCYSGGTVDLRTGVLREARPEDGITKVTAVAPAETADCPLWKDFLHKATDGDEGLIAFLQTLCGYAMTGDTSEHLLAFVYGPGGNGKSTFITTITGVMADYHSKAAMETFTESHYDRHPTDLAALRGARLVTSSETREGRAWDETRIKDMTGGDLVKARFMRCDEFTYLPIFQLFIIGNHKPRLRNITEAMRRRLAIIPFVHSFTGVTRILAYEKKLEPEWPGILRWMIEGCLRWQAEGLRQPGVVLSATSEYFADQDLFSTWVEERLEEKAGSNPHSSKLYQEWVHYADLAGDHHPGDIKRFHEQMEQRGFVRGKSDGIQVYRGLKLRDGI